MIQTALDERKSFFLGLLTGTLITFFLFTLGAYLVITQGVKIQFNAEELARTVSEQVEAQAKLELPQFISQAKDKLPKEMARQATEEFARTNIQLFNVTIKLPESALEGIRKQLEITFGNSLNTTLKDINTEILAQKVGRTSYNLTKQTLKKQFNGKTFMVKTWGWISIPVTVEIN